jgi:hypothetical protein
LENTANAGVVIGAVEFAIARVDALAHCQCGKKARMSPVERDGFYCKCECGSTWRLDGSGTARRFAMRPKDGAEVNSAEGFVWAGRDCMDVLG